MMQLSMTITVFLWFFCEQSSLISCLFLCYDYTRGNDAYSAAIVYMATVTARTSKMSTFTPVSTSRGRHLPFCRHDCTWLTVLLLLSSNIKQNPGPGPALLAKYQPMVQTSLQLCRPIPTKSDGHCLLHTVSISIHNYLGIHINTEDIIKHVQAELANNFELYSPFIGASRSEFRNLIDCYFIAKRGNNKLTDIMPLAVANAFLINIVIVTPANAALPYISVKPWRSSATMPYVIIHLANSHYGGCCSSPALPLASASLATTT